VIIPPGINLNKVCTPVFPSLWLRVLLAFGVKRDVSGIKYDRVFEENREGVIAQHPCEPAFKGKIIAALYNGIKEKRRQPLATSKQM
jgi:hypothetical protein